jgi:gamma-glutamyltranspeptidase / glutathione hydrolase
MQMWICFKRIINILIIILIFSSILIFPEKQSRAKNGMVVSANGLASKVGLQVLKKGGNAVDAAVAVGFALSVTYPVAGNIGGGGFMVIHLSDGQNITIDYREKAPLASSRDMFLDDNGNYIPNSSTDGITSVGVPGSVAGLVYALENYGTMSLNDIIQPAVNLAEDGFPLDNHTVNSFNAYLDEFRKYPSSHKVFTRNGLKHKEGDIFKQPDLAKTLRRIAEKGVKGFYSGKTAELLLKQVKQMSGIITDKDLENYSAIERKPIEGNYRDFKIISMGPPSSGGVALIQLLNIIENRTFRRTDWGSSEYIHLLAESMKYVYADRARYLGDPDFYDIPVEKLISKEYGRTIYQNIGDYARAAVSIYTGDTGLTESTETTHYSVYDSQGNAVSTTTTLNSGYGSKVVVDGAGFLLNNEMDDFSVKPGLPNQFGLIGGEANSIFAGKRMLSSMTPTIVLKEDKPYIIAGSPGGSTIITVVLQVVLNIMDFNMSITDAVNMPRIHHQLYPDRIDYEPFGLSEDVKMNLMSKGHEIGNEKKLGLVEGILIDLNSQIIYGTSDKRGNGSAEGY